MVKNCQGLECLVLKWSFYYWSKKGHFMCFSHFLPLEYQTQKCLVFRCLWYLDPHYLMFLLGTYVVEDQSYLFKLLFIYFISLIFLFENVAF